MWNAICQRIKTGDGEGLFFFSLVIVLPALFGLGYLIWAIVWILKTGQKP